MKSTTSDLISSSLRASVVKVQKAPPQTVTRFVGCDPFEGKVPRSGLAALPFIYRQVLPPA